MRGPLGFGGCTEKGPHVHKMLECPVCNLEADYVMLKVEEAVNCKDCGFELHVSEDFQKYAREIFESAAKAEREGRIVKGPDGAPRYLYVDMARREPDPPGGFVIEITPRGLRIMTYSTEMYPSLDWLDGLS